ncbi:MYXO-CTERM sorting domain-containing protein [Myxococcota bacterium]|nr:MYXO-CTERM sorting domain-containing protein [Myxococcota bacterium]
MSLSLLLALSGTAAAAEGVYSSEPQHLLLSDIANVFQEAEVDSGWLPADSPVQVRFQVLGLGATQVVMEGDADLWWPTDLNLSFLPEPGSGELFVDTNLQAVSTVRFDIFGYSWESEIDSRTLDDVVGGATFDPFVLDDSSENRVEIVSDDGAVELITYSLEVFAGVGLTFSADIGPEATIGFEGIGWQTEDALLTSASGALTYAATGQAVQEVVATFLAAWDATLDLVITPQVDLDAGFLGSYTVVEFEIPITLSATSFEQAFPPTSLAFPLPVLDVDVESYDFGELTVGDLANLNLAIYNDGELDLEGVPALTGSSYFLIYPNYFQAGPGHEDGLVVTFAPETTGSFQASLLLTSNDPSQPTKEILLTGVAVDPPVVDDGGGDTGTDAEDDGTDPTISTEVNGCGCASGSAPAGLPLLASLGLGLVALGRRRRG